MTSADAEFASSNTTEQTKIPNHKADVIESTHDLPARTMTEGDQYEQKDTQEDAATTAASEELKHTTISDNVSSGPKKDRSIVEAEATEQDKEMSEPVKDSTPEADPSDIQDEEMRERISSPKKKRGRDQDDDGKELQDSLANSPGSADGSALNGNRTTRSEPEKKRPRDTSEEYAKKTSGADVQIASTTHSKDTPKSLSTEPSTETMDTTKKPVFGSDLQDKPQTSPTAFQSSGFASLAASHTSGFGSLAASKPSVFGGGKAIVSGFGASAAKSTNTSDKASTGLGFGSGTSSGFGGLGTASSLGNGFAAGPGPKLSSFAAPRKENVAVAKPAKAFGAPEESDEDKSDEDESEAGVGSGDEESGHPIQEEKKRGNKIAKVHIEDGESGEATLLQIRAKLFAIESKVAGWKERGVGTLKINVPGSCIESDENGNPIPGSFDASGLYDADETDSKPKVARLIMRQENTHRVVLNTVIVRAMEFKDKPSTSTAQILFTAFEGDKEPKPINMLLKMSEANAKLFRSEIESIQHEL
ncbi:hypothetical protein BJ875DRAFT_106914 [Amylocarpus encephaloides]|uniref:RanBD1 domain-containing protein n=1 Tax=Amylocarpus encephaloides TaxID=45428 RepID=A0A9P7YD79_9HELO|nr:hypothetical protein BJ875DRAFT_106914 [Amylocarpus encephaloides]